MAIRNDYLLSMIQSFSDTLCECQLRNLGALEKDPTGDFEDVIGRILDMPAEAVLDLSPDSLVTMLQISQTDERMAVYMVYTLQRMADVLDVKNNPLADIRRAQARAVAGAYGFSELEVPPEVQDGLDTRTSAGEGGSA